VNWLDIFFLVPILWGLITGFKKGLIAQVLGLASVVLGVWLGTQYPEYVHPFLKDKIDLQYLSIASFVLIFLIVVIAGALIIKLLEKLVNLVQLKFLNKIGGAILGVLKVLTFLVIIVFALEGLDSRQIIIKKTTKENSIVYPILNSASKFIIPNLKSQDIVDLEDLNNELN
tara:strand:+ start:11750 stop:12265 length:516 start_codon:yes stop_codon:yes gene_type:complete